MKKLLRTIGKMLYRLSVSAVLAYCCYILLASYAYVERHYYAIGGEIIITIAIFIITFVSLYKIENLS